MTKGPRARVLVVDDDPELRRAAVLILQREGYEALAATDGQQALDAMRAGPLPDLVLLDLMMPVLDGWRFRSEQLGDPALAAVRVVAMTAEVTIAKTLRPDGVLRKPFTRDHLLATVAECLAPGAT